LQYLFHGGQEVSVLVKDSDAAVEPLVAPVIAG
jgi:hypothetical protein